jgi:hypothetical protein
MPERRDRNITATIALVAAIFAVIAVIAIFGFAPKNQANSLQDQTKTTGLSQQQRDTTPRTEGRPAVTTSGVPEGGAGSDSTRSSSGPSGTTEGKDGQSVANTGSAPRNGEQR